MRIISGTASGVLRLGRYQRELSQEARRRLKWMDYYHSHGRNARLTCRHFDISPQTLYRWLRRYNPGDLATLEARSRRPRRTRRPTWSNELALAVQQLREQYPWGKDKLAVILREQGWNCSVSMVGRILRSLQQRGVLGKASLKDPWQRPRPLRRPHGIRKPKEYAVRGPGDIVQVDTAHIQPCAGWSFRHYTARDVFTRWDVLEVHSRATANTAAGFLDTIQARMSFPVRAIQVDGGSEFMAEFEDACRERGIRLFVLPPCSPKLNGHVERAQRTHKEEFYEVRDLPDSLEEVNKMLRAWEEVYNCYRPHQALGYLTPKAFYHQSGQAAV